jgi:hypothetical protein
LMMSRDLLGAFENPVEVFGIRYFRCQ